MRRQLMINCTIMDGLCWRVVKRKYTEIEGLNLMVETGLWHTLVTLFSEHDCWTRGMDSCHQLIDCGTEWCIFLSRIYFLAIGCLQFGLLFCCWSCNKLEIAMYCSDLISHGMPIAIVLSTNTAIQSNRSEGLAFVTTLPVWKGMKLYFNQAF